MASQASRCLRVLGGTCCWTPGSLSGWALFTPAELIAAEQPLSTLREWVYGEKFQPAAGVLSPNCFLMGGS